MKEKLSVIKRTLRLIEKRISLFMIAVLGYTGLEIMGSVLGSYAMKNIVNGLVALNNKLFWYGFKELILCYIIWWILAPFFQYALEQSAKSTMRDVKTDLCEHILRLPMRYHDNKPVGELIATMTNDISGFNNLLDWELSDSMRKLLGGIAGLIVMIMIDWKFAIIVGICGIVGIRIGTVFSKHMEDISKKQQEKLTENSTDIYEFVKAGKAIRSLSIENHKMNDAKKILSEEENIRLHSGKIKTKMKTLSDMVNKLCYIILLFSGSILVYFKITNWGNVIALIGLKEMTDMLFVEFPQVYACMQNDLVKAIKVFFIFDKSEENDKTKEKIIELNRHYNLLPQDNVLELRNLDFAYEDGNKIFNNFNLLLDKNSFVAVLGQSGCGKSSLFKLLLGFYMPDNGFITFSGTGEMSMGELRKRTAYVPQESMLIAGSIYENIAYGKEGATMDEVRKAAKLAEIDTFIENLEAGYNTIITDGGNSLSGGQKKRVALARALIKEADLLLLDEITSALDEATAIKIFETLQKISKEKAVLFITHSQDIMKYADYVVTI